MDRKKRASGAPLSSGVLLALMTVLACEELASEAPAADSAVLAQARPDVGDVQTSQLVEDLLQQGDVKRAALTLVFILDGLRPDAINQEDTPNLHALRTSGVNFPASHAVFPTVTRVNASSLATGRYPAKSGIISNSIYAPDVDPSSAISTGDYLQLRKLDQASGGRLLFSQSLGEVLAQHGKKLAVVSSGSTGSAYLLNHRAPEGVGVLINGYLEPGKTVAYPAAVNDAVLSRFGAAPASTEAGIEATDWAETVLRDYVLPELKPDVVLNWITQPDGAQHAHGAGSPEALAVIRNDDRNIGLTLKKLRELGLYDKTNIIVISDHGFGVHSYAVNLTESLVSAGLKADARSSDVVLASSGQAVMIHVAKRDRARIRAIAEHLQAQPWVDAIFTHAAGAPIAGKPDPYGFVPGTFSLALIHHDQPERGADLLVTFPWSSERNRFGVQGTDTRDASGSEATGALTGDQAGHGSMSPWCVRNTWFAWGADFRDRAFSPLPVSNVDIFPTVLRLAGIAGQDADGRVIAEAIEGGPDAEKLPIEMHTYVARARQAGYAAAIQVTELGGHRYVDKSWRIRAPARVEAR